MTDEVHVVFGNKAMADGGNIAFDLNSQTTAKQFGC
jgi:hypothetical protein